MKTKRANVRKAYDQGCSQVKAVIKSIWPDIDQPAKTVKRSPVKGDVWVNKNGLAVLVTRDKEAAESHVSGTVLASHDNATWSPGTHANWYFEGFKYMPTSMYGLTNEIPAYIMAELFPES